MIKNKSFVSVIALIVLLTGIAFASGVSERRFGNTGVKTRILGLDMREGCSREAVRMALKAGAVFVNSSPYIEGSEQAVYDNLGSSAKQKCILTTYWKTNNDDGEDEFVRNFNSSMKNLGTDFIDCVIVDEIREIRFLKKNSIKKAFYRLKKEKKTSFLGVYLKKNEKESLSSLVSYVMRSGDFDFVVLDFNTDNFNDVLPYADALGQKGIGVIFKGSVEDSLKNKELARRISRRKDMPLVQAVMQWAVSSSKWTSAILVQPSDPDTMKMVIDGSVDEDNSSIFDLR